MAVSPTIEIINDLQKKVGELVSSTTEEILKKLAILDHKISELITHNHFIQFKEGFTNLRERILKIIRIRRESPSLNIALDCLGVLARVKLIIYGRPKYFDRTDFQFDIFHAILEKKISRIEECIVKHKFDFNYSYNSGTFINLLIINALKSQTFDQAFQYLEIMDRAGVDFNAFNDFHPSALLTTIYFPEQNLKEKIIRYLLSKGADPNVKVPKSMQLFNKNLPQLFNSIVPRILSIPMVRILISAGLRVNHDFLIMALKMHNVELADCCIFAGAKLNVEDLKQLTADNKKIIYEAEEYRARKVTQYKKNLLNGAIKCLPVELISEIALYVLSDLQIMELCYSK